MHAHELRGQPHGRRFLRAARLAGALGAALLLVGAGAGCKGNKDRIRRDRDAAPVEEVTGDASARRRIGAMEREPNDQAGEAGALALDTVGRGRMDAPGDVDRFKVQVDKPGALTVTVSALQAVDLVVELRDRDDAVLARSDRGAAKVGEGVGGFPVTPGAYQVVVRAFEKPSKAKPKKEAAKPKTEAASGAGGSAGSAGAVVVMTEDAEAYEVLAVLGDAATAGQELEPNPDAGAASEVAIGETVSGLIGWAGDVDVWKLGTEVLAATDALDFEVSGVEGVAVTLEIRDGMSRPQATRKGAKGQLVAIRGYAPKIPEGTPPILYVAVSGDRSNPQLGYQLKVSSRPASSSEELEPNDKPEVAQPFPADPEASPLLHARWEAGDVDCFAIPVGGARRRVEARVSAADGAGLVAELLVGERVVATSGKAPAAADKPVASPSEVAKPPVAAAGRLEPLVAEVPAGARAVLRVRGPAKAKAEVEYDVSWATLEAEEDAMPPEESE